MLNPAPKFNAWNYREILAEGVRPLADKEPLRVAHMLIDATASMIRLGKNKEELESGTSRDHLEVECPKLNEQSRENLNTREILVHTLTYACEKVYEQSSEAVESLDNTLRNQRWDVFKTASATPLCFTSKRADQGMDSGVDFRAWRLCEMATSL